MRIFVCACCDIAQGQHDHCPQGDRTEDQKPEPRSGILQFYRTNALSVFIVWSSVYFRKRSCGWASDASATSAASSSLEEARGADRLPAARRDARRWPAS